MEVEIYENYRKCIFYIYINFLFALKHQFELNFSNIKSLKSYIRKYSKTTTISINSNKYVFV